MHTFFHLLNADLPQKPVRRWSKSYEADLQNNCLVLLLHHFQFAELHHDDTICPVTEGKLRHTLGKYTD